MPMMTNQFPELFRKELYPVHLALLDDEQLNNIIEMNILATKDMTGLWHRDYSIVPVGAMGGRDEAEDIPEDNMVMGFTTYGAVAIEASKKVSMSSLLNLKHREFVGSDGWVKEGEYSKHLADDVGRAMLLRRNQRWAQLGHRIFNLGGIQAGHIFFNQRLRANFADIPNTQFIYDGSPLFALPAQVHNTYTGLVAGQGSSPTSNFVDMAMLIANTGGLFNAFDLPPSYWALKVVYDHFINNMQFDEQGEMYDYYPDTLFVSSFNSLLWQEILKSRFIEPRAAGNTTNRENVFQMEGQQIRLVSSRRLVRNTWYLGKAKSRGIRVLNPTDKDEPWAFFRNEENRVYNMTFEDQWGFEVTNWRCWVGGAIATDGETPPTFNNVPESQWDYPPAGMI